MTREQAYYEQKFEIEFRRTKGKTFQEFFNKFMSLAYKADFMACRSWGNKGDRKNDGFLKSERRLFQVYAPNEMTEDKASAKIQEDFEGAKVHWKEHFDKWTFVHNAVDGLPPHVQKILLDFEKANQGITLEPWGLEELRIIFRRLTLEDLQSWFGFAPTEETKLGFEDLQVVLEHLAGQSEPAEQTVRDVPPGKIEANAMSESTATLLKTGMKKFPLVGNFFDRWHDPTFGERIADSFRTEYQALLQKNFVPTTYLLNCRHGLVVTD